MGGEWRKAVIVTYASPSWNMIELLYCTNCTSTIWNVVCALHCFIILLNTVINRLQLTLPTETYTADSYDMYEANSIKHEDLI